MCSNKKSSLETLKQKQSNMNIINRINIICGLFGKHVPKDLTLVPG